MVSEHGTERARQRAVIHLVAAARPNFMKIAPLYHALRRETWAHPVIVHTGQHYDFNMSDAFFQDLGLPDPDLHLGIGSGSHAEQTGQVMIAYERVVLEHRPDMVIVVGDVNSTIACTLAAAKVSYPSMPAGSENRRARPMIAHLESGLRSFDRTMPEEVSRVATDVLADLLWTPSPDADENLRREGIPADRIVRVGNIMIDSLEMLRDRIQKEQVNEALGLPRNGYGVVTLHRPSNVDDPVVLERLCGILEALARRIPLAFPIHPRTRKQLERTGLMPRVAACSGLKLLDPLNYIRFMSLIFECRLVITDSGGIQEETTYLGIPCLTLRPNTERPITIEQGTNQLCTLDNVEERVTAALSGSTRRSRVPEWWDGCTAGRVVESIKRVLQVS